MLVIGGAAVALALPTGATARTIPVKPQAKPAVAKVTAAKQASKKVANKAAKRRAEPRVLCICITNVGPPSPPMSREEFEAQYDRDLIEHGLDPVFGTTTTVATATD
jgi:hypothetical protein